MRWAVHVALIDDIRNAYRILVGKPESKRPLCKTPHHTTSHKNYRLFISVEEDPEDDCHLGCCSV
jgi:hypothetical protein